LCGVYSGPAWLSGVTDETVGLIRDSASKALYPSECAEVEQLQAAHKHAADAVELAKQRIAARAGLAKGADGNFKAS
jgi:hypothetical protein